jgi:phosphate/sulfate permease
MNAISNPQLMAERLESLKAAVIGGFFVFSGLAIASLLNTLVLAKYFPILVTLQSHVNWHLWLSAGVATFTGFLFGVTYRYIIRSDNNPQLKSGGVLAFGLVRGLAQIELGWNSVSTIWPFLVLAAESVLSFAIAAIALDIAMQLNWVKPFSSIEDRTQNSEDRIQNSEDRIQNSEDRIQNSEDRTQNSEDRTQNSEDRIQNSELK